jgi:mannose-6-phosphate isomerase-like protein (cupin superfamily)
VKTTTIETAERGRSPLGARIRFLMDGPHGNMIHSTVPPGMVGRACHFRTIDEYWYVLSGEGEIWRSAPDGHESMTRLIPGVCVDIPLGTAFQYRCTGNVPLVFTCTALPPWPGDDEAVIVDGPWVPRVDPEPGGPALGLAFGPPDRPAPTPQGTFPNAGAGERLVARLIPFVTRSRRPGVLK